MSQFNIGRVWRLISIYPLAPVMLAYGVALASTYQRLSAGPWESEQEGHGPFILVAGMFLVWRRWPEYKSAIPAPRPMLGWLVLALGLVSLIFAQSQKLLAVETAAQIPIIVGVTLILFGWPALRLLMIPLSFMVFVVPLPGWVIDTLAIPLKIYLSDAITDLLYWCGYPIAQNGVMLTIGPYELLVKDACSGMNSIFSLSAISLFYIVLAKHSSTMHNIVLLASVLPVSIAANFVRILLLVLGTYYFGDEASRGVFHDIAGVTLFTTALVSIFAIDSLLLGISMPFRRSRATT